MCRLRRSRWSGGSSGFFVLCSESSGLFLEGQQVCFAFECDLCLFIAFLIEVVEDDSVHLLLSLWCLGRGSLLLLCCWLCGGGGLCVGACSCSRSAIGGRVWHC